MVFNDQKSSRFLAIRFAMTATVAAVLFSLSTVGTLAQTIAIEERSGRASVSETKSGRLEKPTSPDAPLTTLFTENFSYAAATALNGTGGWSAHSGAGTNAQTVTAPGLTYPGYAGSGVGNSVTLTTTGEDENNTFTPQTTGSVYMAAMVNVTSAQAAGDYFIHLVDGLITGNLFKGRVFVKKDATLSTFGFGIQKSSTANAVYTPTTFATGTTHLVVVKYTFVAGAANDTVDLFVDPTLNGVEPAPTLTALLAADTDAVDIRGVALRQGSAANAAALTVDGIIVGTAWADVAGAPTAADVSVSGRVTTADGRGITNVRVAISGNSLAQPIVVITGRFGQYNIPDLEAGQTYVITVGARRFTFTSPSRVISLVDNVNDADFVAEQ